MYKAEMYQGFDGRPQFMARWLNANNSWQTVRHDNGMVVNFPTHSGALQTAREASETSRAVVQS